MSVSAINQQTSGQKTQATLRRCVRWLTSPQVILSLIMLAVMFYMVIIPLYRMLLTTLTVQSSDQRCFCRYGCRNRGANLLHMEGQAIG